MVWIGRDDECVHQLALVPDLHGHPLEVVEGAHAPVVPESEQRPVPFAVRFVVLEVGREDPEQYPQPPRMLGRTRPQPLREEHSATDATDTRNWTVVHRVRDPIDFRAYTRTRQRRFVSVAVGFRYAIRRRRRHRHEGRAVVVIVVPVDIVSGQSSTTFPQRRDTEHLQGQRNDAREDEDLIHPPDTTGAPTVTTATARRRGVNFITQHVPCFLDKVRFVIMK